MAFSDTVKKEAWDRQGGKCARCCKELVYAHQDFGNKGAWHAHHRKPESWGGDDSVDNCVILCINPPENCHFNFGHAGISLDYCNLFFDSEMPCLRAGEHRS